MFLLIEKDTSPEGDGFHRAFGCATLEDAARITGAKPGDISWGVRRTGRWDSEDQKYVVIPAAPEQED